APPLRLQQEVRVLDALGDALEGQRIPKVEGGQEGLQLFVGDVGIDGHGPVIGRAAGAVKRDWVRQRRRPRSRCGVAPNPVSSARARAHRPCRALESLLMRRLLAASVMIACWFAIPAGPALAQYGGGGGGGGGGHGGGKDPDADEAAKKKKDEEWNTNA